LLADGPARLGGGGPGGGRQRGGAERGHRRGVRVDHVGAAGLQPLDLPVQLVEGRGLVGQRRRDDQGAVVTSGQVGVGGRRDPAVDVATAVDRDRRPNAGDGGGGRRPG